MVTKKRFENRAELLKSNSIRWWPNYQSNSQGIRLLFKLCECTWKKKVQIFFSCWWSWSLIFFGITDALNLFFGRVFWVNMFSFLKSYIHFGWCCWEVLKSTSLRSFQEILRNIGHPNHFLSVFLLISAAIAFAIMWQTFLNNWGCTSTTQLAAFGAIHKLHSRYSMERTLKGMV